MRCRLRVWLAKLRLLKEGQVPFLLSCAPGMGVNLVVKVHCRRGSTSLLAKGKGVHREVESEGSRRQNHGPMNKNPIRG
ncbi:hypothetical protein SAMN02745219_01700 [Desulfofundulus thermosubterraneus DSM 16057]|uniref:Uncharacterized protein n=1 Tax=Desulfofundulus thermosubterraneus DSM 16057 TaxID=1121432 RepID=A0A1M6GB58_9FIRM|nr:hypothetical protein SAMN02745219_01700 [Desulfofundulus thermosubterraneus DSM 16057]